MIVLWVDATAEQQLLLHDLLVNIIIQYVLQSLAGTLVGSLKLPVLQDDSMKLL